MTFLENRRLQHKHQTSAFQRFFSKTNAYIARGKQARVVQAAAASSCPRVEVLSEEAMVVGDDDTASGNGEVMIRSKVRHFLRCTSQSARQMDEGSMVYDSAYLPHCLPSKLRNTKIEIPIIQTPWPKKSAHPTMVDTSAAATAALPLNRYYHSIVPEALKENMGIPSATTRAGPGNYKNSTTTTTIHSRSIPRLDPFFNPLTNELLKRSDELPFGIIQKILLGEVGVGTDTSTRTFSKNDPDYAVRRSFIPKWLFHVSDTLNYLAVYSYVSSFDGNYDEFIDSLTQWSPCHPFPTITGTTNDSNSFLKSLSEDKEYRYWLSMVARLQRLDDMRRVFLPCGKLNTNTMISTKDCVQSFLFSGEKQANGLSGNRCPIAIQIDDTVLYAKYTKIHSSRPGRQDSNKDSNGPYGSNSTTEEDNTTKVPGSKNKASTHLIGFYDKMILTGTSLPSIHNVDGDSDNGSTKFRQRPEGLLDRLCFRAFTQQGNARNQKTSGKTNPTLHAHYAENMLHRRVDRMPDGSEMRHISPIGIALVDFRRANARTGDTPYDSKVDATICAREKCKVFTKLSHALVNAQDMFQLFLLHVDEYGLHVRANENVVDAHLLPGMWGIMHIGELPDLTMMNAKLTFWGKNTHTGGMDNEKPPHVPRLGRSVRKTAAHRTTNMRTGVSTDECDNNEISSILKKGASERENPHPSSGASSSSRSGSIYCNRGQKQVIKCGAYDLSAHVSSDDYIPEMSTEQFKNIKNVIIEDLKEDDSSAASMGETEKATETTERGEHITRMKAMGKRTQRSKTGGRKKAISVNGGDHTHGTSDQRSMKNGPIGGGGTGEFKNAPANNKAEEDCLVSCMRMLYNKVVFHPNKIRQINQYVADMSDLPVSQEQSHTIKVSRRVPSGIEEQQHRHGDSNNDVDDNDTAIEEAEEAIAKVITDSITDDPIELEEDGKAHREIFDMLKGSCDGKDLPTGSGEVLDQYMNVYYLFSTTKTRPLGRRLILCLIRIILASLMGLYDHCGLTLSFEARRELYRHFLYNTPSVSAMKDWFLKHKFLFTYTLRENHLFYLENMPGLERVFIETYDFSSIRRNVIESTNVMRHSIQSGSDRFRRHAYIYMKSPRTNNLLRHAYEVFLGNTIIVDPAHEDDEHKDYAEAKAKGLETIQFSLFRRKQEVLLLRYLHKKHIFSHFTFLTDKGVDLARFFTFIMTPYSSSDEVETFVSSTQSPKLLYNYLHSFANETFFHLSPTRRVAYDFADSLKYSLDIDGRLYFERALINIMLQHTCAKDTCSQTSNTQMRRDYEKSKSRVYSGKDNDPTSLVLYYTYKGTKDIRNAITILEEKITLRDTGVDIVSTVQKIPGITKTMPDIVLLMSILDAAVHSAHALYDLVSSSTAMLTDTTNTTHHLFKKLEKLSDQVSTRYLLCHISSSSTIMVKKKNISVWFLGLEKFLKQAYIACLVFIYRPRIISFEEEMVNCCSIVSNCMQNQKNVERVMNVRPGCASEIMSRFVGAYLIYTHRKKEIRARIREVLNFSGYDRDVGVFCLVSDFGVRMEVILMLEKAQTAMHHETNRRMPHNVAANIACHYPYDFYIIADFYREKYRFQNIRSYPLDTNTVKMQIQSAHKTFNYVPVGKPLPKVATEYYYCLRHLRFCAHIVGSTQDKTSFLNTQSIGPNRVAIDPINDKQYCAFHLSRSTKQQMRGFSERAHGLIEKITAESIREVVSPLGSTTNDGDMEDEDDIMGSDSGISPLAKFTGKRSNLPSLEDEDDDEVEDADDDNDDDDDCGDGDEDEELDDDDDEDTTYDLPLPPSSSSSGSNGPETTTSQEGPESAERFTKRDRRGSTKKTCKGKELVLVNMLGIIFSLGKSQYVLCPFCVHLMRYTSTKWTEIGLWCGVCIDGQQALAERYGVIWDDKNKRPLDYVYPRFMGPYPLYWNPKDLCCIICETRSTETRPMSFFLLFNDLIHPDECRQAPSSSQTHLPPARKSLSGSFFTNKVGYYPLCRKHSRPYVSMTVQAMRISNLLYLNYRYASATLHGDEMMARGLSPRYSTETTGDINILDCMDSTTLYYEASCRRERELRQKIVSELGVRQLERYKISAWDNDSLFNHSSTSKYRTKFSDEGPIDKDYFSCLFK
jgi:hypothetical protein